MSLIEYLDRTGKHISAKTFEKYKNENLDWSKPHTDAEILAEIGLPEDFLSTGANYIYK